jgi:hypothetical protein
MKAEEDSRLEEVLAREAKKQQLLDRRGTTKRLKKRVPLDLEKINAQRRIQSNSESSEDSESEDGQGDDKKRSN